MRTLLAHGRGGHATALIFQKFMNDNEIWKPLATVSRYEVSSLGRIRNRDTLRIRKPYKTPMGYLRISLVIENSQKGYLVHRLVSAAFMGPLPEGQEVNHKNGVKTDNRVENLEYMTRLENMRHADKLGLNHKRVPMECVMAILQRRRAGYKAKEIVDETGFSFSRVTGVLYGKFYRETRNAYFGLS